ncbi:MAG: nicotinamide riboside transporter PnuC [Clostridia bacterium]|nr:nicotinamide riboside transporter PnuC [Clostridia bacterium]
MKIILDSFKNWKKVDYALLIVAILMVGVVPLFTAEKGWLLTFITSLTSIVAGILNYKGRHFTYPVYVIYAILYTYVSLTSHMYGEAILYGIYALPMYIYSSVKWLKNLDVGGEEEDLEIYSIDKKHLIGLLSIGVVVLVGYGYILSIIGSAVPYLNSLSTVCSASAIYMTNKRYKQQWYAWLSYSFTFAAIWMSNMTITFAVQSAFFVVLNILGLINWNKEYRKVWKQ